MASDFQVCISQGSYDTVSPGEVCTLDVAKKLGVSDSKNYFKPEANFNNVKVHNDDVDTEERNKSLCSYTSNAVKAYEACSIEHGIGFVRKVSDGSKCMTFDCPPGFDNTGVQCKKPLEDYAVSKQSRCDERWYDWFMIPNYHLGNKYYSPKAGQCYKPCPAYQVPQYAKDPVDDTVAGANMEEHLDKCVSRNEYMYGKYEFGSDYCPIAWVHRLAMTPEVMNDALQQQLDYLTESYGSNLNTAFSEMKSQTQEVAKALSEQAHYTLEPVNIPTTTMAQACQTLHSTERVMYAYDKCAELSEDESSYTDALINSFNDSQAVVASKIKMHKQACNALFCNSKDRVNDDIGKPPLCMEAGDAEITYGDDDEKERPTPYTKSGLNSVISTASAGIKLGFFIVFVVLFFIFLKFILWPYVLWPIVVFFHNFIFRRHSKPWHVFEKPQEKAAREFNKAQSAKLIKSQQKMQDKQG